MGKRSVFYLLLYFASLFVTSCGDRQDRWIPQSPEHALGASRIYNQLSKDPPALEQFIDALKTSKEIPPDFKTVFDQIVEYKRKHG
ncbi:MAG TPA: hypothetical protein VD993_00595 [Chitinophagaceae bacterium]|nr:hypothetical protein [Chitinophagaceae bacterium]